jgi:[protein-PII] uridylyltransferase
LEAAARGEAVAVDAPPLAFSARRAAFEVLPVVAIDADAADGATVIEVSGADRPGLLADLARTFADEGLSIRSAHIASFGARAVDAFYVTDAGGQKPRGGPRMDRLATALEAVLDRAPSPAEGRRAAPVRASTRDVSELKGRPRTPAA